MHGRPVGFVVEDGMNNLAYDIAIEETATEQADIPRTRLFIVSSRKWDGGEPVLLRAADLLDWELERGAMPA